MIAVLIIVGICWFVSALLFVLALCLSARRRSPLLENEQNVLPVDAPVAQTSRSRVRTHGGWRAWPTRWHPKHVN